MTGIFITFEMTPCAYGKSCAVSRRNDSVLPYYRTACQSFCFRTFTKNAASNVNYQQTSALGLEKYNLFRRLLRYLGNRLS